VSFQPARRTCVLIGNLEPMLRLGMSRVLAGDGFDVVDEKGPPAEIVEQARRLNPDAVVLALSDQASRELGEEVRAAAPEAKVFLVARDETTMEVLGPGLAAPRRVHRAVSDALLSELSARQPSAERT
jgi:DNA-binding NarL/FixJ family response regulator